MSSGNWMRYLKKIKPYTIKKGIRYLKHYGPKESVPGRSSGSGKSTERISGV